jgi:hypothetical protein
MLYLTRLVIGRLYVRIGILLICLLLIGLNWIMEFDATFNYISVIPWRSVLLVEETGKSGETYISVTSH